MERDLFLSHLKNIFSCHLCEVIFSGSLHVQREKKETEPEKNPHETSSKGGQECGRSRRHFQGDLGRS